MSSQDTGGTSLRILQGTGKHKDPVCGMMVAPEKAAAKVEHTDKTYYFCSTKCSERFSREPEKFLVAPGTARMDHGPAPSEHGAMENAGAIPLQTRTDGKKIRYINVNDKLADLNGKLYPGMTVDRLHPTPKGYQIWADAMAPTLEELLK